MDQSNNNISVQQIITPIDNARFSILSAKSQPCSIPPSFEDKEIIAQLDSILTELNDKAAGIAAIQVGYPKQIFLTREGKENFVFINPEIIAWSKTKKAFNHGCLSLPGFNVRIKTPKEVTIRFFDLDSVLKERTFTGFMATVIYHEILHLRGELISDHLEKMISKQVPRTKFGMKLTSQKRREIQRRRQKRKATGR